MINQLLDEPYWNEIDEVINQHLGNNKLFLRVWWKKTPFHHGTSSMGKLFFRLLTPKSAYILNEEKIDAHLLVYPNRRWLWDAKRLVHYCEKRLPLVKSQLIFDIDQEASKLWSDYDATDPHISLWTSYMKKLSLEDNIHEIFKVYQIITELKYSDYKGTWMELIKELSK